LALDNSTRESPRGQKYVKIDPDTFYLSYFGGAYEASNINPRRNYFYIKFYR